MVGQLLQCLHGWKHILLPLFTIRENRVATPPTLGLLAAITRFGSSPDSCDNLTVDEGLISISLIRGQWTEDHTIRLLGKLMCYESLHASKEEVRQEVMHELLGSLTCD